MDWLPWSSDAFERAARERKPVLLSITAAWCRACHEMDRTTYADAAVAALARQRFVAVRVDSDRRPDINDRYNLGGWPTTAFLTPAGALIGGGTFIAVERMPGVLTQVADAFAALDRREPAPGGVTHTDGPPAAASVEAVFATFDAEHGGFGIEPKFPITGPLHLALALARTG
ncbi:MAG TPA: DUF255 domain-containing protein, partial [Vicinamibacterales bacterium]|nr:DUF255 domain-containing protein [Vicinamibacterales bacterium]